jgi:hypothetical protein
MMILRDDDVALQEKVGVQETPLPILVVESLFVVLS